MPSWSQIVQDILHTTGWTQRELARRTGLLPQTINKIANGKVEPTYVNGAKLVALHHTLVTHGVEIV